jgi:hypothetical protein
MASPMRVYSPGSPATGRDEGSLPLLEIMGIVFVAALVVSIFATLIAVGVVHRRLVRIEHALTAKAPQSPGK